MSANIAVFISGSGSNLKALFDAIERGEIDGNIHAVIADRACQGMQYAVSRRIPFFRIDRKLPPDVFAKDVLHVIPKDTDLIILAGFLSILPPAVIQAFPKRIINLHPSLLPKYGGTGMYGLRVHRAVLAAGDECSGCTVHYVDDGVDTGEIIAQAEVPVHSGDDAHHLQKRVQRQEHELLCQTVAALCRQPPFNRNKDFA